MRVSFEFRVELKNSMKFYFPEQTYLSEYDFIIVGSGPAGCVLANRLSENPYWNVLLIEAGNVENAVVHIPVFAAYTQLTDYSWNYVTVPQENGCLGESHFYIIV